MLLFVPRYPTARLSPTRPGPARPTTLAGRGAQVVAATGSGCGEVLVLREADMGLSIGVNGTVVAQVFLGPAQRACNVRCFAPPPPPPPP